MAFDGIVLKKIIDELNVLIHGKVNRIFEPTKNELIFSIYSNGKTYALNIDISANNYRLHLTTNEKSNPYVAPNFCMLLRKYLIGSKISKIYMHGLERIAYIEFETFNEMNDKIFRTLAIELMGKYSNAILLTAENTIIDALKRFDNNSLDTSRCIMPARKYIEPHSDKLDFTSMSQKDFISECMNTGIHTLDTLIPSKFVGISKLFIQSSLENLKLSNTVSENSLKSLYDYISNIIMNDAIIRNYKNNYTILPYEKIDLLQGNFFLDDFYYNKFQDEYFKSYRNNLLKIINGTLDKIVKKFDNINRKLDDCKDIDSLKIYGELLLANIYKIDTLKISDNYVLVENYYENNAITRISIDNTISTSKNAENYFKKYNKKKNTLAVVNAQKKDCEKELDYLESLTYELDNATDFNSVTEIYNEISESLLFNDNLEKISGKTQKKSVFTSSIDNYMRLKIDNYVVLVGKNNRQNDYLTTKIAKSNDYWFHTKDIHGSHVILRTNGGDMPKQETILKCASIAAYHSKAKFSSHVPVDYTLIKYVKKPTGSVPGYVIYTNNKTVFVEPSSLYTNG